MSPFPTLDPIYGAPWPLYDYSENLIADTNAFTAKFSFVSDSKTKVHSYVISMSVLAAFFFILGVIAITVLKIKYKKKNGENYEKVSINESDIGNVGATTETSS